MNHDSTKPAMSQKIFSMNLDVEAVSLYLLCCAVVDAGTAITRTLLREKWNGTQEELNRQIDRLEEMNILVRKGRTGNGESVFVVADEKKWRE
jgi:predicted HTH transcriptional regulator